MDVGSLFSKYVGDSEEKLRKALATAEAVAPCVMWLDEIEKAFGTGGGETDGGTSGRVLGTFLTWMQERKEGVFVIATSNDISKLPAEFTRAGRWDDVWFVDLPNLMEREEIAKVMAKRFGHCKTINAKKVAAACEGSTGAEIEQAFKDALYVAYSEKKREVSTDDVVDCIKKRVPLSISAKEKISALRKWASEGRARFATEQRTEKSIGGKRAIE
jgi:SpoVK/Ycf46/Vps4 family AAA+-type ATPase